MGLFSGIDLRQLMGPGAQFTPGPMPNVPFMPQAQVGPQFIPWTSPPASPQGAPGGPVQRALQGGFFGGPRHAAPPGANPNMLPQYAPVPGQTPNYNQQPGTQGGPAARAPHTFNPFMAQAGMNLMNGGGFQSLLGPALQAFAARRGAR